MCASLMKVGQLIAFVSRKAREAAVPPGVAPEDAVHADAPGDLQDASFSPDAEVLSPAGDEEPRTPLSD